MLKISIVIPVRNRKEYTKNILSQLFSQIAQLQETHSAIDIIVIDDGSTDGTREFIKDQFPNVHLIEGDGSLWWTGAIVRGMQYAMENLETDYFIWLNDDIYLLEEFILNLTRICLSSRYKTTIVGGIVRDRTYTDWIVYGGIENRRPISNISRFGTCSEIKVDFLCGNVVVIPRIVVDTIGLPNAVKLPHHGSDYMYTMAAKKAGFEAILTDRLQATTDYQIEDFFRYMPYWIQWYFQPDLLKRWKIIKGLISLKSNQNIWMIVNTHSSNRSSQNTPVWNYIFCYFNKLFRLLVIDFISKNKVESRIQEYFLSQSPPQEIIDEIVRLRKL